MSTTTGVDVVVADDPVQTEAVAVAGFLAGCCDEEQLVDRNPALNVRRPKVDYQSRTSGWNRNELGAFRFTPNDRACTRGRHQRGAPFSSVDQGFAPTADSVVTEGAGAEVRSAQV